MEEKIKMMLMKKGERIYDADELLNLFNDKERLRGIEIQYQSRVITFTLINMPMCYFLDWDISSGQFLGPIWVLFFCC